MVHEVTCQAAQALQIGDEVEVTILAVEAGQVRLGIIAPEGHRLMRIDPVPLPAGAGDIRLLGLERTLRWSSAPPWRKE